MSYDIIVGHWAFNSQQSTVNSQQSTVNSQQSTSPDGATEIDMKENNYEI